MIATILACLVLSASPCPVHPEKQAFPDPSVPFCLEDYALRAGGTIAAAPGEPRINMEIRITEEGHAALWLRSTTGLQEPFIAADWLIEWSWSDGNFVLLRWTANPDIPHWPLGSGWYNDPDGINRGWCLDSHPDCIPLWPLALCTSLWGGGAACCCPPTVGPEGLWIGTVEFEGCGAVRLLEHALIWADCMVLLCGAGNVTDTISWWQNTCGNCPADYSGDGAVDVDDFLMVLAGWGEATTINDGLINAPEFLGVLAGWGSCPSD